MDRTGFQRQCQGKNTGDHWDWGPLTDPATHSLRDKHVREDDPGPVGYRGAYSGRVAGGCHGPEMDGGRRRYPRVTQATIKEFTTLLRVEASPIAAGYRVMRQ